MDRNIRIVIAEDDPQIAEIQQRFLQRIEGCETVGIAHGLAEAQDLVEVLKPDLLLLDVQFPTGTGLDLLRQLRAHNIKTDVILVTAAQEVATLREALHGGVFDYILKPLVFERLQESLLNYGRHLSRLQQLDSLAQRDVDRLLQGNPASSAASHETPAAATPGTRLPKGVDALTLEKVIEVFARQQQALNAEEVGAEIGASRTTARRYLEYLTSTGQLKAEVSYGSVGRPERRYRQG
ncbi:response regulator [Marinobacterium jannaschii]|uniref:response regulator n=1 Tax=Marinobacterium jannaschii TaxID=64970 RepID=UPI0004837D4D|nr:response regulator [Marinobacterium jannaschii]